MPRKWEVHLCLGCNFSKNVHAVLPELKKAMPEFEFEIVLMSLPWHFSAMHGMIIGHAAVAGGCDRDAYISAVFAQQEKILNNATVDLSREQMFAIYADIAEQTSGGKVKKAELVQLAMTRKPIDYHMKAWAECKIGIAAGVMGSPKHVVDGKVLTGTDSAWGVAEYKAKAASLPAPGVAKTRAIAAAAALAVLALVLARR